MATEFYRKSAALYEEFKKRELHYLNIERCINNSHSQKNDTHLPLQDYLEKINKREKKTEKAYRDLLKHLEEMDKRTDQMSLKLEKLNALRNVAVKFNPPSWLSGDNTFDEPLQPYNGSAFLQKLPTYSFSTSLDTKSYFTNAAVDYSSPKLNYRSESTQTEHLFCEQCHYPFTMNYNQNISRIAKQSINSNETFNVKSISNEAPQLPTQPVTAFAHSMVKDDLVPRTTGENNDMTQNPHFTDSPAALTLYDNHVSLKEQISSESKEITTNREAILVANNGNIKSQVKNTTMNDFVADMEKSPYTQEDNPLHNRVNVEKAASKSDDESMNHEFDFLESDRRPSMVRKTAQPETEVTYSKISNTSSENLKSDSRRGSRVLGNISNLGRNSLEANSDIKFQSNRVPDAAVSNNLEKNGSVFASDNTKIDSSLSEGLPSPVHHSENASNNSESDSSSEKDTPLTASAAYQALLGNVSATKSIQKKPSLTDSDSEDEIESALATAVRRSSNINFDSLIHTQKTEERKVSTPEVQPQTETRTSKPVSASKPQNKLSKNTRKVLGLETSSGSEMELEVKPTVNKIDEESDEFDFYN